MFLKLFRVLPNFHECFYKLNRDMENMLSISFRKPCDEKKRNLQLVYFDHQDVN